MKEIIEIVIGHVLGVVLYLAEGKQWQEDNQCGGKVKLCDRSRALFIRRRISLIALPLPEPCN